MFEICWLKNRLSLRHAPLFAPLLPATTTPLARSRLCKHHPSPTPEQKLPQTSCLCSTTPQTFSPPKCLQAQEVRSPPLSYRVIFRNSILVHSR
ncbi:hypothetical protein BU23DRAFT_84580 [Bimuria novae-zelandiae CBS 107.79]|uniref:Uncharacterized protein n=1 Tax=Bimuria novae-zelandiae CBS 107.79 TaxID=1447943 RepID=A0A6A5VBV7_9PLEO|nr:hypothetical protein BU23DRAFT_84580 [Bimuria novae-zelandiae CBS 107.79]